MEGSKKDEDPHADATGPVGTASTDGGVGQPESVPGGKVQRPAGCIVAASHTNRTLDYLGFMRD